MSDSIYIGTSGYSYNDWLGPVYTEGTQKSTFLHQYSQIFSFTEINSSYYHIPSQKTFSGMVERTPANFRFSVKVHKSFTHERKEPESPEGVKYLRTFLDSITPMVETGKLLAVVAQFPWSFRYTPENRRYLSRVCEQYYTFAENLFTLPGAAKDNSDSPDSSSRPVPKPWQLYIEFRNSEWLSPRVWQALADHGLMPVYQDGPQLDRLPGHLNEMAERLAGHLKQIADSHSQSSGPAYIRFHGRNSGNWWTGTNVSRYDYLYSETELQALLPAVQTLAAGGNNQLIMAFNNHHRGQAVQNARSMLLLIDQNSGQMR